MGVRGSGASSGAGEELEGLEVSGRGALHRDVLCGRIRGSRDGGYELVPTRQHRWILRGTGAPRSCPRGWQWPHLELADSRPLVREECCAGGRQRAVLAGDVLFQR